MALFEEKLDEDRDKWTVWFDGASNVLGHGVGAVLVSLDNQSIPFTARPSRRQLTLMSKCSKCTGTQHW